MNQKVIRLDEEQLKSIVLESVLSYLAENNEDEGLWNQIKQGVKSFMGNGYGKNKNYRNSVADNQAAGDHTANWLNKKTPMNLKKRFNAAKSGFKEQGNIDNANEVRAMLQKLMKDGTIKPEMTVKQVMNKMMGNRLSAQKRVSKANNAIYEE